LKHWRFFLPALIISGAVLLASYWVFLVPIFQEPDEDYHADYVFSLYSRGGLIRGKDGPIVACSHPYIAYLLIALNARPIKYSDYVKVSPDYGTVKFYRSIDRNAPDNRVCAAVKTTPYVVAMYPVGYYALAALWLNLVSHISNKLTFLFFAGRFLSVFFFACGLALSYLIMREQKLSYVNSVLILAAIAFFPMATMVGSYIQPDNLCFVLVSLSLLLALRWRNTVLQKDLSAKAGKTNDRIIYLLSVSLAGLLITKLQFICCVGSPILAMILATAWRLQFPAKRVAKILLVLAIPSVIAYLPQLWISWRCHLPTLNILWFPVNTYFKQAFSGGWHVFAHHIWQGLYDEYESIYWLHGATFSSFWGRFGWMNVPLVIISPSFNQALRRIIEFITEMILLLTLASIVKVLACLWCLAKKKKIRHAFYMACSNPVINSYFLFEVFFFLFNAYVYPSCGWQGRHWFTLILPIILSAAFFAPRVIQSTSIRRMFSSCIIIGWLCYSIVGSYYALGCVRQRYYEPDKRSRLDVSKLIPVETKAKCRIEHCDFIDPITNFDTHPNTLMVPRGDFMQIIGWAVDPLAEASASAALIYIDRDKIYQPTFGVDSWQAVERLHNQKYRFSGFSMLMPTKDLSPGWHSLAVKVVSKNGRFLYNTDARLKFLVLAH